ncbi:hypothetical protein F4859DRAFT_515820 [Xylaria cf. heliscus]|nr:hypothetical protein F4859DRAFT_515820 [Xylaria cf. heliscus]
MAEGSTWAFAGGKRACATAGMARARARAMVVVMVVMVMAAQGRRRDKERSGPAGSTAIRRGRGSEQATNGIQENAQCSGRPSSAVGRRCEGARVRKAREVVNGF